jgi:preprotein translocase subunit Sec61beta
MNRHLLRNGLSDTNVSYGSYPEDNPVISFEDHFRPTFSCHLERFILSYSYYVVGGCMSVRRKREGPGPITAAGLVSFYRDIEANIQLKPVFIFLLIASLIALVTVLRIFMNPF